MNVCLNNQDLQVLWTIESSVSRRLNKPKQKTLNATFYSGANTIELVLVKVMLPNHFWRITPGDTLSEIDTPLLEERLC